MGGARDSPDWAAGEVHCSRSFSLSPTTPERVSVSVPKFRPRRHEDKKVTQCVQLFRPWRVDLFVSPVLEPRNTHCTFAFAAAERITFIHNYAAENVSAPFLLQSCAGVGACLENRDHFISYLLALVLRRLFAATSHSLFQVVLLLFLCYVCDFFPLKIAVARAGKNISNNLHRIERRRKKKIESEFSWWGFDFETGSATLELITDSTTLPKSLRTLSCISAHLAPLCSRILKRIMWVHLKQFFLTPFSSLIIF